MAPIPDVALVARFRHDLSALIEGASVSSPLGVAVSGGADSLAALLLAAAAFPGRIAAVSIDHGLRADAADECRYVARLCEGWDIPHDTIAVEVRSARLGVQAGARRARRRAWRDWAERHGVAHIVTGHHADDQAETILMRLARGSGVAGLSGMPATSPLGGTPERQVRLLRPCLAWTRAELAGIVASAGVDPVTDPSNRDPRFDRTRFRALLGSTELLPPRRLAATARHARDADDAIGWAVDREAAAHMHVDGNRVVLVLAPWPREIARRLVLNALAILGAHPDDGPQVARLLDLLDAGRTATLAGIKAVPTPDTWIFTPAPPRRPIGPATRHGRSA